VKPALLPLSHGGNTGSTPVGTPFALFTDSSTTYKPLINTRCIGEMYIFCIGRASDRRVPDFSCLFTGRQDI
jgi:hypothetical protein